MAFDLVSTVLPICPYICEYFVGTFPVSFLLPSAFGTLATLLLHVNSSKYQNMRRFKRNLKRA